jgi:hypothetical protein
MFDAVIGREGRWRRPQEFFDAASGTARERSSVERDFPEHFDERPLKLAVHAR